MSNYAEVVQSWYPLATSHSLKAGAAMQVDAFGQRLVLFRSGRGELGLMQRNCVHMGGDLSLGKVTESGIRCPIHNWEFSTSGQTKGGAGTEKTKQQKTCQKSLTCQEANGIIHGYFGSEPAFDLPTAPTQVMTSSVYTSDVDISYDVPAIFGFDTEHFETVHKRGVDSLSVYQNHGWHLGARVNAAVNGQSVGDRIMRAMGMHSIEMDTDFWAANILFGHHRQSNTFVFLSGMPLGEHRTRVYASLMQERPTGGVVQRIIGRLRFAIARPVIRAFISQDENALAGVRFDPDSPYILEHSAIHQWLDHYRSLPRFADWHTEEK